jgi:hypothetical protein
LTLPLQARGQLTTSPNPLPPEDADAGGFVSTQTDSRGDHHV